MPDLLVCRACLAYNVPVYNILRTRYQDVFERIAFISVSEHSKPHALCAICLETLDKCCRLLEKTAVSEGILNRLLQQNQLNEDAIKALDRQQHNLAETLPTFTLEHMRPNEKSLEDKVTDSGPNILPSSPFGTQKLEDSRNNVGVKTEPSEYIEGPRDVMDIAEPATNVIIDELTNQSDHTVLIETVKGLLNSIKSEINSNDDEIDTNDDEIVKTSNVPGVPENESLKKYIDVNVPIDTEFGETKDSKNYSNSGKEFEESKAKEERDLERKIKPVSTTKSRANEKLKAQNTTNQSHRCTQCDYQTPFRKRLIYHMKKHGGFVMCDVCDYQCATKSILTSHLLVHANERVYKCKECNRGFTELYSLSKHVKMHKGLKTYKCTWCVYEAACKSHLDRHIKIHIGDKRFKCELCEYACVQKWDLNKHVKTHENDKARPYRRVTPVVAEK